MPAAALASCAVRYLVLKYFPHPNRLQKNAFALFGRVSTVWASEQRMLILRPDSKVWVKLCVMPTCPRLLGLYAFRAAHVFIRGESGPHPLPSPRIECQPHSLGAPRATRPNMATADATGLLMTNIKTTQFRLPKAGKAYLPTRKIHFNLADLASPKPKPLCRAVDSVRVTSTNGREQPLSLIEWHPGWCLCYLVLRSRKEACLKNQVICDN